MANVYLKIEIKNRELISRILIGMYSALKGNNVYIGDLHNYLLKNKLSPGIFLDKSISRTSLKIEKIQKIKKFGHIITSIDEECGVTHTNYNSFAFLRYSEKSIKNTSAVFCWGDEDFNFLKKKYPLFNKVFFKTGSPRSNVCKILKSFDKRDRLIKLPKKKYLVISSNFGSILTKKPLWKTLNDRKVYYKKKMGKENIETEDFRLGRDIWKATLLKSYIKLISKLSKQKNKMNIIIRPHPSEVKEYWQAVIDNGLKNVFVLDDYSSSEILNFAEVMIHSGCHTALEANLMNTPVISFNPTKQKTYERKFYTECGTEFFEIDKLVDYIEKKKYLKQVNPKKFISKLNKKFFIDNNYDSAERISDIFEKLINDNKLNNFHNSIRNNFFFAYLNLKSLILNLFISNFNKKYYEHKFDKIENDEISNVINIFKKYNKDFKNIKFKKIGKKIIKIWVD